MKLLVLLFVIAILAKEDYYKTLGLQKGADIDTVKKQFRKLSLKYHPDKNKSPGADQKYKQITHAYQQIVDGKADEEEDNVRFQRNNQNFYSRTYTFTDDPFSRRTYYQSYHYSTQPKEQESYYFSTFLLILLILFGVFLINFVSSSNSQQKDQENQENQNSQNNENQRQQNQAGQQYFKESQTLPKDIKEKVSNVSSYTESNHRFSFYENYNQ